MGWWVRGKRLRGGWEEMREGGADGGVGGGGEGSVNDWPITGDGRCY